MFSYILLLQNLKYPIDKSKSKYYEERSCSSKKSVVIVFFIPFETGYAINCQRLPILLSVSDVLGVKRWIGSSRSRIYILCIILLSYF